MPHDPTPEADLGFEFGPDSELTTFQASVLLTHYAGRSYTAGTLNTMRSKGRGPTYLRRADRRIFYRPRDLKSWADSMRTEVRHDQPATEDTA